MTNPIQKSSSLENRRPLKAGREMLVIVRGADAIVTQCRGKENASKWRGLAARWEPKVRRRAELYLRGRAQSGVPAEFAGSSTI